MNWWLCVYNTRHSIAQQPKLADSFEEIFCSQIFHYMYTTYMYSYIIFLLYICMVSLFIYTYIYMYIAIYFLLIYIYICICIYAYSYIIFIVELTGEVIRRLWESMSSLVLYCHSISNHTRVDRLLALSRDAYRFNILCL